MQPIDVLSFSHIGFVVPSVEEFQQSWGAIMGIDDWLVRDIAQVPGRVQLHGEVLTEASQSRVAFAKFRGTSIELVEPRGGGSGAADWLDTHGGGMQHIGVWVRDLPAELAKVEGQVEITYSPAVLRPELADRPVAATVTTTDTALRPPFWAYLDSVRPTGTSWSLELLDAKFAADYRAYYGNYAYYPGDLPDTTA